MIYNNIITNVSHFDINNKIVYQNNVEKNIKISSDLIKNEENIWWSLIKNKQNRIGKFVIHPVGFYCPGTCTYCINNDEDKKTFQELSVDKIITCIHELFSSFSDRIQKDKFTYAITGGSPFFYNNIENIINTAYIIKNQYLKDVRITYFLDGIGNFKKLDYIINIINKYSISFESKVVFSCDFGTNNRSNNFFNFREKYEYMNSKISKNVYRELLSHYAKNFDVYDFIEQSKRYIEDDNYTHKLYCLTTPDELFNENLMYDDFSKIKKEISLMPNLREKGYFVSTNPIFIDKAYCLKIIDNVWKKISFNELNCSIGNTIGIAPNNYFLCFYGKWKVQSMENCINISNTIYEKEKELLKNIECDNCISKSVCSLCLEQKTKMPCSKYPVLKKYMNMLTKDRYSLLNYFYDFENEMDW